MLIPQQDRVVLKRVDAEEKSAGGIILPELHREKSKICEVVAVGPGRRKEEGDGREPMEAYKVGSKVLVQRHAGTEYDHEGQKYLIVTDREILALYEE